MYDTVPVAAAVMSPLMRTTEIEPPISSLAGASLSSAALPAERIGIRFEPSNIFASSAYAGAENPLIASGTAAVIVWSSIVDDGCATGGSGACTSQLPRPPIASLASPVGASLRHSAIDATLLGAVVVVVFVETGFAAGLPLPPLSLAAVVGPLRRGTSRPSSFMSWIGVQPPIVILLKLQPYDTAHASLSSM